MYDGDDSYKKNGIQLSPREIGQAVAVVLLGAFFVFVGGYFLGKKKMLEEISAQQNETGFAQKVYNSLLSLNNSAESTEPEEADAQLSIEDGAELTAAEIERAENVLKDAAVESPKIAKPDITAYAQLSGFGRKSTAQAYLDSLTKRKIDAQLVERTSRSSKGKEVVWYQVVTNPMAKNELLDLVAKIKKADKLTDIKIIDIQMNQDGNSN